MFSLQKELDSFFPGPEAFCVCLCIFMCLVCFTILVFIYFIRVFSLKFFNHIMGCAGTFHLSLYSLLYGGLRVTCTINMKVRGSRKFKFCSGSYRRQVSGQLQSLCLLGQEYQAYSGWKRSRKTLAKPEFSFRDRGLRLWCLELQPKQVQCWTGLYINKFPYSRKLQDNYQSRMKNIYMVHGRKGLDVPKMNIITKQELEMTSEYIKSKSSLLLMNFEKMSK